MSNHFKGLDTQKISISTEDLLKTNYKIDRSVSYLAIDYKWSIQIVTGVIKFYYQITLPKGYRDVTMTWKMGIINKNNNPCQSIRYTRTQQQGTTDSMRGPGDQKLTTNKALDYMENNVVTFFCDLEKCEYEHCIPVLVQALYEKFYHDDDFYLIKFKETLAKTQNDYKELLEKYHKEMESRLTHVTHPSVSFNSISAEVNSNVVNMNIMSLLNQCEAKIINESQESLLVIQEQLFAMQSRITNRLKDLNTCCVCMDQTIKTIFIPCGHKCVCSDCSRTILNSTKICPTCRVTIVSSHSIF